MFNSEQHIFGPVAPDRLALRGIRFIETTDEEGAGGDDNSGDDKGDKSEFGEDGVKKFTQADVDRIVAREKARVTKPKPEPTDDNRAESKQLTDADVQKRIDDALAAKDMELALERAGDALDKALEGREFSASKVRSVQLEQFVKDGKTDDVAVADWVEKNSTERKPSRDPSQGQRGSSSTAGSVQSGRDLFDNEKKKSTT